MSILKFTWKRADNTPVTTNLRVGDLTAASGHAGRGDMFIFHIMAVHSSPARDQWEAMEAADRDPIDFWQQVHRTYPKMNLPSQLYSGTDRTWIAAFQAWAAHDLDDLRAVGGDVKPVCRITAVSIVNGKVTVKTVTVNH